MEKEELIKLSHVLYKRKVLYSRACELSERAILNEEYLPLLVEALQDIKKVNEEFVESKMREQKK